MAGPVSRCSHGIPPIYNIYINVCMVGLARGSVGRGGRRHRCSPGAIDAHPPGGATPGVAVSIYGVVGSRVVVSGSFQLHRASLPNPAQVVTTPIASRARRSVAILTPQ